MAQRVIKFSWIVKLGYKTHTMLIKLSGVVWKATRHLEGGHDD